MPHLILIAGSVADSPLACVQKFWPALLGMVLLLVGSGFFSSSEACYFYLTRADRQQLSSQGKLGRLAVQLLSDSDRLLTAVLFWNLVINVLYFTISSIISLNLDRNGFTASAGLFGFGSLMTIIVVSEMLPKCLAVIKPRAMAYYWSVPLALAVRIVTPVLKWLQIANLLSRRLLCPAFRSESYLRISDLQRALSLSNRDAKFLEQEQQVLQKIVYLSQIRAEELMRPRNRLQWFMPPIALGDLNGQIPSCGYLLVTEDETEEIVGAAAIQELTSLPLDHLEHLAEPVIYVPWCTTVANALEAMQNRSRQVAVVVNEYGETVGILTFRDILDTLFGHASSRVRRILNREPIRKVAPGVWHVTGLTILKRLRRHFRVKLPQQKSMTVGGVVQEQLERLPVLGDRCSFGPFDIEVIEADDDGQIVVQMTMRPDDEEPPTN